MQLKPIPYDLLTDEMTLLSPHEDGYESKKIWNVRVVSASRISEYNSVRGRDTSEITVYYDCENSYPSDVDFEAGMLIVYNNTRYEILSAEQFKAETLHHIKITARKV